MDEEEKSAVMEKFRSGEYRIVVSTTVIEVGIDVPNATVMVVEQAERFGLSTIHQLRGRVGRGGDRSFCFLVPDRSTGRESFQRLKILKETRDGFKIAEWDLRMRGPGEILGKKQSGVPSFLIDDLGVNTRLIHRAQKDARRYIDGEVRDEEERERYLASFTASEGYRRAMLYFGG
jgi:ATP-dependent DNA helicase RecG